MSNELAKPKSSVPIIRTPDELQKYMMQLVESKSFAERYAGIVDRKSLFLAVQAMRNLWWQIKDPAKFDWGSVIVAAGQAGAYGWSVDGVTGHAYLVPYGNQVKLQPGYKGWLDLVNRAGKCVVTMAAVYQGDRFEYHGQLDKPLHVHSNNPARRLQPVTHVYVLAAFGGGIVKCFCWSKEECLTHRDRFSKGWRGVRGTDKEHDNPWSEKHPGFWVMCAKSVLSDAARHGELPYSIEHRQPNLPPIELGADEETIDAVSFQSPARFDETLHTEPQAASVGDNLGASAATDVQEQTVPPTLDPEDEWRQRIMLCGTAEEVERETREATDAGFLVSDVRELRLSQLEQMKTRGKKQRPLPGE